MNEIKHYNVGLIVSNINIDIGKCTNYKYIKFK